ncbi:MAG: 30S ribosomal protein S15 [Endomicrobium sp.]|nr:30S ribosomal protein S15 [Endomicrobium sp.]
MAFVKKEIVEQYKTHATDTGSPEVQVALLTTRIKYLSNHFKKFPKDFASRVGFLKMVREIFNPRRKKSDGLGDVRISVQDFVRNNPAMGRVQK